MGIHSFARSHQSLSEIVSSSENSETELLSRQDRKLFNAYLQA